MVTQNKIVFKTVIIFRNSAPGRPDFLLNSSSEIQEILEDEVEARDEEQCDECREEHPVAEADRHGDQEFCLEAPLQNDGCESREGGK